MAAITLVQIQRAGNARIEEYQQKCTSCGACCSYFSRIPGMIHADGPAAEDSTLSRWREEKHVNQWPDGDREEIDLSTRVMKTQDLGGRPACVALQGEVGSQVGCSIYETRPQNCRLFEPGSVMCIAARAWAGITEVDSH